MSLIARMANVFAAPGEVFEQVKASPPSHANWLAPVLLLIVISWLSAWLMSSQEALQQQYRNSIDKAMQSQIDSGKIKPEDVDNVRELRMTQTKIGGYVAPVFVVFIQLFWWSLILWLLGAKLFKGNVSFMKAAEVCGLAGVIGVLDIVIHTLLAIGLTNPFAGPNLAVILKDPNPATPLFLMFNAINVITFWELAVRSVGLARIASVSFAKAAAWVIGLWLLFQSFCIGVGAVAYAAMPK